MQLWQKNKGGTPLPSSTIEALLTKPEPVTEEITSPLDVARLLLEPVISSAVPLEQVTPIQPSPETQPEKRRGKKRTFNKDENTFDSWTMVFLDPELAKDNSFTQGYRHAINYVLRAMPETFEKYGNPEDPESQVNHLGAIASIYTLKVADLNKSIDHTNLRNIKSTARMLSLVLRAESYLREEDIFVHHEELLPLALEIRSGAYPDDQTISEILANKYWPEVEVEQVEFEDERETEMIEEVQWQDRFPQDEDELVLHAAYAFLEMHRSATTRETPISIKFPMREGTLTKLFPSLTSTAISKIENSSMIKIPSAGKGREYDQETFARLFILSRFGSDFGMKKKEACKILDKISDEDVMTRANEIYSQWLEMEEVQ